MLLKSNNIKNAIKCEQTYIEIENNNIKNHF